MPMLTTMGRTMWVQLAIAIVVVKAMAILMIMLIKIVMTLAMALAILALQPNAKVTSKGIPNLEWHPTFLLKHTCHCSVLSTNHRENPSRTSEITRLYCSLRSTIHISWNVFLSHLLHQDPINGFHQDPIKAFLIVLPLFFCSHWYPCQCYSLGARWLQEFGLFFLLRKV